MSQSDVAKIFKVSRQTFSLWLKDYKYNTPLKEKIERQFLIKLNKSMLIMPKN